MSQRAGARTGALWVAAALVGCEPRIPLDEHQVRFSAPSEANEERCDGEDNDSDGAVDEGLACSDAERCSEYDVVEGQSIQSAIDLADEGATICVGPGRYPEPLVVDKALRLIGATEVEHEAEEPPCDGVTDSVLDGRSRDSPVVFIKGARSGEVAPALVGFCVTGGAPITAVEEGGGGMHGGGVRVNDVESEEGQGGAVIDQVCLEDLVIFDNHARGLGGGLQAAYADLTLIDVILRDNSAGTSGGGMVVDGIEEDRPRSVRLELDGVTFADNTSEVDGGAAYIRRVDEVSFNDVRASRNRAGRSAGCLSLVEAGQVEFSGVEMEGCTSEGGHAGAMALGADRLLASDLEIRDSVAVGEDSRGGAIYMQAYHLEIRSGTFQGNEAGLGGAIQAYSSATTLVLEDVSFLENSAREGGAISMFFTGDPGLDRREFTRVTFRDNSVASGTGGAVHASGQMELMFEDVSFEGNQAELGAAITLDAGATARLTGGQVVDNKATSAGGGLLIEGDGSLACVDGVSWSGNVGGAGAEDVWAGASILFSDDPVTAECTSEGCQDTWVSCR